MTNRVDIKSVAARALQSADSLVREWLPDGRREGHEWKALNPTRSDSSTGSFSINLNTGAWGDFATGDQGGDLVSLYAYLNSLNNGQAAKALAEILGMDAGRPAASAPAGDRKRTDWQPLQVVPASAPPPPDRHPMRGLPDAAWRYETAAGELIGLVYRFRTSDGGKEILPCVYAEHARAKTRDWRWMAFTAPRPLYGLPRLDARPVLIVEGEKCADAAYAVLGGAESPLSVLTWPGGSKATSKVDFSALAGRNVLLWPDCDAQVDREGKTLPEAQQPGVKAMEAIAALLRELKPPAKVKIVAIPPPGAKPAGWDVADAVEEGATREDILDMLKRQRPPRGAAADIAAEAIARIQEGDPAAIWESTRERLIFAGKSLKDCRENVIYVVRDHPEWHGVFGADAFAKRIVARKASPLGHSNGDEWLPIDAMRLGLWLTERVGLQVRSLDVITDAVSFVAGERQFHPVREFLNPLPGERADLLDTWMVKYLGAPDCEYTRLVGRFFLINLVRRVYEPGCVMRSVVVLEGQQDKGKSTALRLLAQPWFSDTPFSLAHKDVYQLIQGVLIYEISELESFTRAEASAVKAFVSSVEDNFRAPYERQNERHRRQTVFAATTNAIEYLKDWTGNTRFWPIAIGDVLDLEGLARDRELLLGAARRAYIDGARAYPTREQQEALFKPEQDRRMMSHPWMDLIVEWMDGEGKYLHEITTKAVMKDVLKIDLARINPQGGEAQRVGQILHALGYMKRRASGDARGWHWQRPKPVSATGDNDDDIPF